MLTTILFIWAAVATVAWIVIGCHRTRYSCEQNQTIFIEVRNGDVEFVTHMGCTPHYLRAIVINDDLDTSSTHGILQYRNGSLPNNETISYRELEIKSCDPEIKRWAATALDTGLSLRL